MENPLLPSPPPDTPYIVGILVGLLSICLIVAGYLYREHSGYRNRREAADLAFRDDQLKLQQEQYRRESEARDVFRNKAETAATARFDAIDEEARTFHKEAREIFGLQQKQIDELKSKLDRLNWEKGHQKPPTDSN